MKRILFVDDEPHILEGLRHLLRRHRRKWDMVFVEGGEEALVEFEKEPFNVVISDMRMPGLDGATLLGRVQQEYPETVRIVLSGYSELEGAMRAVPVAHQFLTKPCDAETLENVVERGCSLQELVNDEVLLRVVGRIEKLPSLPRIYTELRQALASQRSSVADVAHILEQDMAICAKLLQLVNSSFFRAARNITSVEDAVVYLGFDIVRSLALSAEVFNPGEHAPRTRHLTITELQRHSLQVANVARQLGKGKRQAEDAFLAAMLHDIGKLVLATEIPEHIDQVMEIAVRDSRPLHEVEQEITGVTHAEVGAYLIGIWGLPYPIVEAVANHHCPGRVPQREFDALTAVYVANLLVHEARGAASKQQSIQSSPLDQEYLASVGVAERVDSWRDIARKVIEAEKLNPRSNGAQS